MKSESVLNTSGKLYIAKDKEIPYRQLLHRLPAAIYTCDASGKITSFNKSAVSLWGREPELGKDMWCGSWRIYKPDGSPLPLDECPMAIALKEERAVYGQEIIVERPDGKRLNILPHPQPLFDESGILIGAVNMLLDITPRKQIEDALRESEQRFRVIADTAPVMIWMSGTNNQFTFFNKVWLQFTGRTLEEEFGNGWAKNVHPDDLQQCLDTYIEAFNERKEFHREYRLARQDGQYRWLSDKGVPHYTAEGVFKGYIGSCTDITDKKLADQFINQYTRELEEKVTQRTSELKKANGELQRSNSELEQFAYVASHDLQEPLRKITTFANRLMETGSENLDESTKLYINKISSATQRMSDLINDLLEYSRTTRALGRHVQTDLNSILKNALTDLELLISQKQAVVNRDVLPVLEAVPLQMRQLFHNLISNSLKFSVESVPPVISITARQLSREDAIQHGLHKEQTYYELIFADNGIGFPEEFADQIFEIFLRLHPQHHYSGSGIGLAICRKIIHNHHGVIFAESRHGKGASFHVILPLLQPR